MSLGLSPRVSTTGDPRTHPVTSKGSSSNSRGTEMFKTQMLTWIPCGPIPASGKAVRVMGTDPTGREGPGCGGNWRGRKGPRIGYTDALCRAGRAEGLGV